MRDKLKDLIFVGRINKTFKLYGQNWTLSTLTSGEQLDATSVTDGYDTLSRVNALKISILARSIKKIGDEELNDIKETTEFVSSLQAPLINELFTKYEELQKEQDDSLKSLDEIKN